MLKFKDSNATFLVKFKHCGVVVSFPLQFFLIFQIFKINNSKVLTNESIPVFQEES